jgi:hypothetical protein
MNSIHQTSTDVIAAVKISDIYHALTGAKPRQAGAGKYRARAIWRDGDGVNVSLNDCRGCWYDFRTGEGGGVLDLVQLVRGGTRQEALLWLADYAGKPLADNPLSPSERAEWAKARRDLEQALPDARHWQRAAVNMSEDLLVTLKAALFDPTLPQPASNQIYDIEQMLSRLRRIDGTELVTEYHWWQERYPGMTNAMIRAVKAQDHAAGKMLRAFLGQGEPCVQAA